RDRIELASIRAPHDGVVQSVRVQVGQLMEEYKTVMIVADPASRELQVEIRRSEDINKIARGQDALVEVRRDQWAPATVTQITERETGSSISLTYVVHLQLEEGLDASGLRLGDLVSVRL